ncbi:hypothetical protein [Prescottella agglutinans]|uniref:Uncharacterized protein n=1 Tax=Prescottella agglutinans TaxID=1644129 RepID=A0ABT6MG75_9NOCA|nr:hypothetical protein [Prescottella agglutinans]MDH6282890.1 hypothetical protein [Prescottella agglutinans]
MNAQLVTNDYSTPDLVLDVLEYCHPYIRVVIALDGDMNQITTCAMPLDHFEIRGVAA